jgi:diacylglycerol O-acyltransferase
MSAQDALWLTMDRSTNLMIIDGVLILAGCPDFDAVLDTVRTRVSGRFPVYRRKPVRSGAGWAWQDDPAFDASRHVKRVQLPEPADIPALQRFMSLQRAKPLPRNRPLWVIFVVDRVRLDDGTIGSAIVCRFHHAMADGVRLTQVMLNMCDSDTQRVGSKPTVGALVSRRLPGRTPPLPVPLPSPVEAIIEIAVDAAKAVGQGLGRAADVATHLGISAGIAVTDAVVHAVTDPIGAVSALPGAIAEAPRVAWYLLRYSAETVDEGIAFAVHPSRLADAITLLGDQDNRAVNDASSVTKLLLSRSSPTLWSGEPGTDKAIAWSSPLSLPALKAISRSQRAR